MEVNKAQVISIGGTCNETFSSMLAVAPQSPRPCRCPQPLSPRRPPRCCVQVAPPLIWYGVCKPSLLCRPHRRCPGRGRFTHVAAAGKRAFGAAGGRPSPLIASTTTTTLSMHGEVEAGPRTRDHPCMAKCMQVTTTISMVRVAVAWPLASTTLALSMTRWRSAVGHAAIHGGEVHKTRRRSSWRGCGHLVPCLAGALHGEVVVGAT